MADDTAEGIEAAGHPPPLATQEEQLQDAETESNSGLSNFSIGLSVSGFVFLGRADSKLRTLGMLNIAVRWTRIRTTMPTHHWVIWTAGGHLPDVAYPSGMH